MCNEYLLRKRCKEMRKDLKAAFTVGMDTRDPVWKKLRAKVLTIWSEVSTA